MADHRMKDCWTPCRPAGIAVKGGEIIPAFGFNETEENKDAPVVISSDETLRNNVGNVIKSYDGVQADVKDGVVTLRGNIKQEELQTLIMKVQELKPKKVENQLVIKS